MLGFVAVTSGDPTLLVGSPAPRRTAEDAARAAGPLHRVCPFIISADGAWRSAQAGRDQRCSAVEPAAILALDKQSRLCLSDAHRSCLTFRTAAAGTLDRPSAATAPPRARVRARPAGATTRWAFVRTAPARLDDGRGSPVDLVTAPGRRARIALGGVLAVAVAAAGFLALPISRDSSGEPGAADGRPGGAAATRAAESTGRPLAFGLPAAPSSTPAIEQGSLRPSGAPADAADASPPSSSAATPRIYVVREGDTLYAIAVEHGTTVAEIQRLNGMESTVIRAGLVLRIP